jgi:hypothetical protein
MNKSTQEVKKVASPAQFLNQAFGRHVSVKLTNDTEYKGNYYILYLQVYFYVLIHF